MNDSKIVGRALAKATEGALGRTGDGKPQVGVTFRIDDEGSEFHGRELTWYGYFGEKSKKRTLESLMLAGWDGEDISELSGLGSAEVQVSIERGTWDGNEYTRIAFVNAPGVVMKDKMTAEEGRAFAASLRGDIIALRPAQPKKKSSVGF